MISRLDIKEKTRRLIVLPIIFKSAPRIEACMTALAPSRTNCTSPPISAWVTMEPPPI